jgi:large subunit ribosomal protein L28
MEIGEKIKKNRLLMTKNCASLKILSKKGLENTLKISIFVRLWCFRKQELSAERLSDEIQEFKMARECYFLGKKTTAGRSIARRGKAKYLGGVGKKTTGVTKRKFKANIQKVRAVVNGKVCRIKVSAKALKMGLVVKPPKRDYKPAEQSAG